MTQMQQIRHEGRLSALSFDAAVCLSVGAGTEIVFDSYQKTQAWPSNEDKPSRRSAPV